MPTVIEGLEIDPAEVTPIIVRLGPLNLTTGLYEPIEKIANEEYRSVMSVTRMLLEYGLRYLDDPTSEIVEVPERKGGLVRVGPLPVPLELRDKIEEWADN